MSRKPIQCILDFDGTLTKRDTMHLVAQAGYKRQAQDPKRDRVPPWQDMVDGYLADYKAHVLQYTPRSSERRTIASEFRWLDSLHDVEKASADRVDAAGVFDHVTKEDMEDAAYDALESNEVELRPGWAGLLIALSNTDSAESSDVATQNVMQVVSVNWSRWFIWSILRKAAASLTDQKLSESVSNVLKQMTVYANEVSSISNALNESSALPSPAGQAMTLRTAGDKLQHMQSSLPNIADGAHALKIYIGDSITDLECLLMADIGICMRDPNMGSGQKELESTCTRLGVQFKTLEEAETIYQPASNGEELERRRLNYSLTLYIARNFQEITQWIARITSSNT